MKRVAAEILEQAGQVVEPAVNKAGEIVTAAKDTITDKF